MICGATAPAKSTRTRTAATFSRRDAPAKRTTGPTSTCVTPIGSLGNAEITTIEGLGTGEQPHPLQKAFIDEQAAQCGYCVSGMIMKGKEILDHKPQATEAEVREGLAGHLCRCGTHNRIVAAIMRASKTVGRG